MDQQFRYGRTYKRLLVAIGIAFVITGLAMRPTVVGQLLAGRNLFWTNRVVVWSMDITLALVGFLLCVYSRFTLGSFSQDLKQLIRSHRRTAGLLFGVSVSLFLLFVLEAGLSLFDSAVSSQAEAFTGSYMDGFFQDDPVLGYKPRTDCTVDARKRIGSRILYDVRYTIDARGHRVTPSGNSDGSQTVLFFGGSFAFGEGVSNNETLPHQFCLAAGKFRAVNAAFCGYGPQQMLAVLEAGQLDALIQDQDVVAIYVFIDGHVRRAIGSMRVVTYWGGDMPHYRVDDGESLVRDGSFKSNRPISSWLYALASKSQILRRLEIDLPPRLTLRHFELTARIIDESAQLLASKSRNSRFFVVFYPGSETALSVADYLQGTTVECLDYSGLFPDGHASYCIPGDGHPNAAAHQRLAQSLASDVVVRLNDAREER